MIELEYNLTLEDEINNVEVIREYVSQLPLLYWQDGYFVPIMFLFLNLSYIWKYFTSDLPFYTGFQGVSVAGMILNFVLAGSLIPQIQAILPTHNLLPKYTIKRSRSQNPNLIKPRKIIVTDTEFVFEKLENYLFLEEKKRISYSWEKLRRYFESDPGIILEFSKEDRYFIPQRIFTNQTIDEFRKILSQHGN